MHNNSAPYFASWERSSLVKIAHDLWDNNIKLREANEQLRLDNKDLSKMVRDLNKETSDDRK